MFQLDIAEAFNVAYVGSKKGKGNKNQAQYKNWRTKKTNAIYKLLGQKQYTVWDTLKRSRKLGK